MSFLSESTAYLQGELGLPKRESAYSESWWEGPLGQVTQSTADWVSNQMEPGVVEAGYTEPATYPLADVPAPVLAGAGGAAGGLLIVGAALVGAKLLGVF